ncbi:hypothetical protein [Corallincola spongiicola]|uniref:Uncharacterized protein n=1 Tax=Corallincola spongiicola TaxID=2520508 RepID=A0ABY1WUL9_9GAMM|nr:hypothetical protein [Corallincola spongiicola]TAA48420.1 hypothetical protein EXY25_04145 [Corallincola spongiicola]
MGLLAFFSQKRIPIPTGDAEDYWEFACGVELEAFDGYFPYAHWTGIFPNKGDWYFYYYQEHHGRHVYKVSKQSLLKQTEDVFKLLDVKIESSVQSMGRNDSLSGKNTRRLSCLKAKETVDSNKEEFIDAISNQSKNQENTASALDSFDLQWERSNRYWVSIVFEAIFLPLWWLFSFHGGVFGKYNSKISVRLAVSPLLLFTPFYLGYTPYLFSSGGSGGILYPLLAMLGSIPFIWIPYNSFDIGFLNMLPRPLAFISQVPSSQMAVSFFGGVSPTILFTYIGVVLGGSKLINKYRSAKSKA